MIKPIMHNVSSKYKGVSYWRDRSCMTNHWSLNCYINGTRSFKKYPFTDEGEKQAAMAYDVIRINNGKSPVNILKKK